MNGYQAILVPQSVRDILALGFPPRFPEFIGHHVTLKFGVLREDAMVVPRRSRVEVVGYTVDGGGLEVLVVKVNGTEKRLDGATYHITWSLDRSKGFKPVDSNRLIRDSGWKLVACGISFDADPVFLG